MSLQFPSSKAVGRIGAAYRKIANGQGKPLTLVSEADLAPSTVNRDAHCRKRASLHFRFWHQTVMAVLSPQVRYEGVNGPNSVAVRGPSLTDPYRKSCLSTKARRRVAISYSRNLMGKFV